MFNTKDVSWLPGVASVLVVAVLGVMGCAAPEKTTEEEAEEMAADETAMAVEEEAAEEMVEYLFVQHAEGVTLEEGVLTLEGIGDTVLYFSDRPHRIVGRETLEEFLAAWTEGEESFAEVPPNAVLTAKQVDELRDLVVVLNRPRPVALVKISSNAARTVFRVCRSEILLSRKASASSGVNRP